MKHSSKCIQQNLPPDDQPVMLLLDEKLNALSEEWSEHQAKKQKRRKHSNVVPDYDWDRARNVSENRIRCHNISYDRSSGPSPARF